MDQDDILFGETDGACAICGIRGPERLTVHHIDEDQAHDTYDNKIVLCHNCHNQYHQSKGLTRKAIEARKRHLILKTLTQYGVNALKIADRNNVGVVGMPFLLYHLVSLGYLTREETVMTYGDVDTITRFALTPARRDLVGRWLP